MGKRFLWPDRARGLSRWSLAAALIIFFSMSALVTVVRISNQLFVVEEVGEGDSYVLYDTVHFEKTRRIYWDPSKPPYLPAIYSPLIYTTYAAADAITAIRVPHDNIFFGPRLAALTAYVLSLILLASIVKQIIPGWP